MTRLRPSVLRSSKILVLAIALCALFAENASAQISLPPKKSEPKGNVAPYLECTVCGHRNYTSARDGRRDKDGNDIAWCEKCKRDTSQRPGQSEEKKHGKSGGNLHLPPPAAEPQPANGANTTGASAAPSSAPGTTGQPSTPGAPSTGGAASTPTAPGAKSAPNDDASPRTSGAAGFIFTEVRKAPSIEDHLALKAVDSLLALGEPGLDAARIALNDSEPTVLMTAARVLMRSGNPDDIELVKNRVRGKLPPPVGVPLVDELVRCDPVRVTPRYLCELLESSHAGVRMGAERALRAHLAPDLLPLLEPVLASKRAESRLAALALASDIDDPSVTDLVLAHVADPSSKVASSAVSILAGAKDPGLDAKLLAMAFKGRWMLRDNSYALVAIVEREDLNLKPILDESYVEPLLNGLQANDPFVAGACASALAGIGFRSPHAKATTWLDQAVMDRLVFTVSGKEFHNDFTALSTPALRRLRLVSGQEFGKEGPRWVEWWLAAREGFFARRACIEVEPADVGRVTVRFQSRGDDAQAFALLGPAQAGTTEASRLTGEVFYLTPEEARDLVAVFEREGVFGPEKLPGVRGARGPGERTLDVAVSGRGKSFTFGASASEPWFERAVAAARSLREKNGWQRYPDPSKHASSFALWQEESAWWSAEHTSAERALRLKALILAAVPSAKAGARDSAVDELARLYAEEHVARAADFTPISRLLADEPFYSEHTHKLVGLAIEAAREAGTKPNGAPSAPSDAGDASDATAATDPNAASDASSRTASMPPELGRDLINLLYGKFHAQAGRDLAQIARACGSSFARELAHDERPLLRAVAAAALSAPGASAEAGQIDHVVGAADDATAASARRRPDDADLAVLMKLLEDKDHDVEVAAIQALGENRIEAARTELLVRARLGTAAVRVAALQAIGKLGGDLVLDALVVGASDSDLQVRVAAAKGLASLADPTSTQLLVSMLSEGRDAAVFEPVRAALAKIGKSAWPELLRAAHTPGNHARREAAFLLSEQGLPEAASVLMTMLTTTPADAEIARELSVLTCVDMRGQPDPPAAWWNWWDSVVHDDSMAWFLGALERAAFPPPGRDSIEGRGNAQGRAFLVAVMARPEAHLVERARRELSRILGRDLGEIPPRGTQRDAWLATLRESLQRKREQ
jgi:HEAT repeat protein